MLAQDPVYKLYTVTKNQGFVEQMNLRTITRFSRIVHVHQFNFSRAEINGMKLGGESCSKYAARQYLHDANR